MIALQPLPAGHAFKQSLRISAEITVALRCVEGMLGVEQSRGETHEVTSVIFREVLSGKIGSGQTQFLSIGSALEILSEKDEEVLEKVNEQVAGDERIVTGRNNLPGG